MLGLKLNHVSKSGHWWLHVMCISQYSSVLFHGLVTSDFSNEYKSSRPVTNHENKCQSAKQLQFFFMYFMFSWLTMDSFGILVLLFIYDNKNCFLKKMYRWLTVVLITAYIANEIQVMICQQFERLPIISVMKGEWDFISFNSVIPGGFDWNFNLRTLRLISVIGGWGIISEKVRGPYW